MACTSDRIINYRAIMRLVADPLYKNSLFIALTSMFNAGCGFFFWMIAAKLYTVDEVGLATALISSLGFIVLVSMLGFDFSIIRFSSSENKTRIFSTSIVIVTMTSLLIGSVFILQVESFAPSLQMLKIPIYALAFIITAALNTAANITGRAFIADTKANLYFFQNILMSIRIPLLFPLVFLGTFGIFGSASFTFLLVSLFGILILRSNTDDFRLEMDMDFVRRSLRFSSRNYLSNILSTAPNLILPIMVLNMLGEAEAAKYYITFAIGQILLIVPNSLGISVFVEGSHGKGLKESVIRAGEASMAFLIPAVIATFLFGDLLLGLIGEEYQTAFDLLRVLALSSFFVTVYSLFIPIQNVRMEVEVIVLMNAFRCILLLMLSYTLMGQYGILGAGYAWMITNGIIALWIASTARRQGWI